MTSLFEEITSTPDDGTPVRRVTITVNGRPRTLDVEPRLLLAHLLRQALQLTAPIRAATRPTAAPAPCSSTAPR